MTNMNYLFILNAILNPLLEVFEINELWKKILRWWHKRRDLYASMKQRDLNLLYEGPIFSLPQRYSNLQKTIFLTSFYATAMPISMLITLVGLFLKLWSEKVQIHIFIKILVHFH
jgi:hypothetical protein